MIDDLNTRGQRVLGLIAKNRKLVPDTGNWPLIHGRLHAADAKGKIGLVNRDDILALESLPGLEQIPSAAEFPSAQLTILRAKLAEVQAAHDAHPDRLTVPWRNLISLVRKRLEAGSVREVEKDLERLGRMVGLSQHLTNDPRLLSQIAGKPATGVGA